MLGKVAPASEGADRNGLGIGVMVVILFVFFGGWHSGWEAGEQRHWDAERGVRCGGEVSEDELPYFGREPREWVGGVRFGLVNREQQGYGLRVAW